MLPPLSGARLRGPYPAKGPACASIASVATTASGVIAVAAVLFCKALKALHAAPIQTSVFFFLIEDCVVCSSWLLLLRLLSSAGFHRSVCALAVPLSLSVTVVALADCAYFLQMGEALDLRTVLLVLGAADFGTLRTVARTIPYAISLLVATGVAFVLIITCCTCHYAREELRGPGPRRLLTRLPRRRVCAQGAALLLTVLLLTAVLCGAWLLVVPGCCELRGASRAQPKAGHVAVVDAQAHSALRANVVAQLLREGLQQLAVSRVEPGELLLPVQQPGPSTSDLPALAPRSRPYSVDVVLVLLEGVRYSSLNLTQPLHSGLSRGGALEWLRAQKMLVHSPHTYATIPNTLKQTYGALCGVVPDPPLTADMLPEYRPHSALLEGCLPRVLRRRGDAPLDRRGEDEGYYSTYVTSSVALEEVHGRLGFDAVSGANTLGSNLSADVGSTSRFAAGEFERVNWLGYDDAMLLAPALDAIDAAHARRRPAFVTLGTVGTHSRYGLPSRYECDPEGRISLRGTVREAPDLSAGAEQQPARQWASSAAGSERDYECAVRASIGFLEELVARLTARDPGLARTILVVASDHGEAFGEHGQFTHGTSLHMEETQVRRAVRCERSCPHALAPPPDESLSPPPVPNPLSGVAHSPQVPLLFAGGPIARAIRSGALVLEPALGPMAVGGVHRLEDIVPTVLDLLELPALAAEAERRRLHAALAQLGLGGRSLLWASRHSAEASRRALLMHSMYGTPKLGLLRASCGACGALEHSLFTYKGCRECEVLDARRIRRRACDGGDERQDSEERMLVSAAASAPDHPLSAELHLALKLLAAAAALHSHARGERKDAARANATLAAASAAAQLRRANALVRGWLDADLSAPLESAGLSGPTYRPTALGDSLLRGSCLCRNVSGRDMLARPLPHAIMNSFSDASSCVRRKHDELSERVSDKWRRRRRRRAAARLALRKGESFDTELDRTRHARGRGGPHAHSHSFVQ